MLCGFQGGEFCLEILDVPLFPLPEGSLATMGERKSARTHAHIRGMQSTGNRVRQRRIPHLTSCGTGHAGCTGSFGAILVRQHLRSTILSLAP